MDISLPSVDCLKAAAILEIAAKTSHEPELLQVCTNFLKEAAAHGPEYHAGVDVAKPFLLEARNTISLICREGENSGADPDGRAFALLECFAVIALEHSRHCDKKNIPRTQADVRRYFENCGHWRRGDGTVVCEYYYNRIPAAAAATAAAVGAVTGTVRQH